MDFRVALAGLTVGFLIGLTGVGSGSLLAPLLLLLRIPPAVVVGSDLGYSLLTKMAGVGVHLKKGAVRWRWVALLSAGSLPAAVIGSRWLSRLAKSPATIQHWIGAMLVATALLALGAEVSRRLGSDWAARLRTPRSWAVPLLGAGIGLVVGVTSVGSGSLIDIALILFSPLSGAEVIGTGMAHGILLSGVAAAAHWSMGTVNSGLIVNLLVGSVPGVLLGSQLAHRTPAPQLKVGVAALILVSGISMI